MRKILSLFSLAALIIYAHTLLPDIAHKIGNTTIQLIQGDITKITGYDAIVNAANTMLSHGGGVALAISQAAGPKLQEYSFAMPSMGHGMGEKLKVGQAVITPAFNLSKNGVEWIIHAVGPKIPAGTTPTKQDAQLLYNAYFNSLLLAKHHAIKRIAFPSISTALFGYDIRLATPIAQRAITDFITQYPNTIDTIAFILFDKKDYQIFEESFAEPAMKSACATPDETLWQRITNFINNLLGWK